MKNRDLKFPLLRVTMATQSLIRHIPTTPPHHHPKFSPELEEERKPLSYINTQTHTIIFIS